MRKAFAMFVMLLLIPGCGQESLNKQHELYLSNKGWEIKELLEVDTYQLEIPDEMLSNFEASGITFLGQYIGVEVTEYFYKLKEKEVEGKPLEVILFEVDGDIIGGYGILPNWEPGTFNLDDKERLRKEQKIKK
ncbi:DUF4830 domain-containing protein [Psychrobacillus sp. INOP01]|uniref:DUF4830 domain-containing protein n=1 Tax=Psychrobacillus sp. INOP01 TaxID=2829187 RepID=UPI001BAC13FD|nr:DUF4830 domain-containing protein [Psychrobacillus sp. INOP01]QUG41440.1 DUF4830 domain-containing protein [Psychrobacillus sp. INOP01]